MDKYEDHVPVLLEEVLELMAPKQGGRYIDGTVGCGGHAQAIVTAAGQCELLGIDRDEKALAKARERLSPHEGVTLVHAEYRQVAQVIEELEWPAVDGILLDIGMSSLQLDDVGRGFSFQTDGPLDMRMDRRQPMTASRLLNGKTQNELTQILRQFGEEPKARQIAAAIVKRRQERPWERTGELVDCIRNCVHAHAGMRCQEVVRCFQALRIAVNDELSQLDAGLTAALSLLRPGGRLAVISFHSLEDRVVKTCFKHAAAACTCPPDFPICCCGKKAEVKILTRRPVTATDAEINRNRRAASAKMRVAEKL